MILVVTLKRQIADYTALPYAHVYRVRGVSQIKFTMSDSFLVLYDFDILFMIKRKNPFGIYCVILIFKVCRVWFLKCIFDFQNLTRLISKIWRVWFLKWHFWFPKFVAFDFSNDTFDFQNLSRLISQMTLSISKICRVWFLKWHLNETDMDDIHVTVGGKPFNTHGKARGTLSQ